MSFLSKLANLTKNVGRGALDVFTLGGNELGHHFGGDKYKKLLHPIETGMGANLEAGAAGSSALMGAQGIGALLGGGSSAGVSGLTPYMPTSTPNLGAAGITSGPGGMFSSLNPMGIPSAPMSGAGNSGISTALKLMRMMPNGGGQQQQQENPALAQQEQQRRMQMVYSLFPNLRPGGQNGSRI